MLKNCSFKGWSFCRYAKEWGTTLQIFPNIFRQLLLKSLENHNKITEILKQYFILDAQESTMFLLALKSGNRRAERPSTNCFVSLWSTSLKEREMKWPCHFIYFWGLHLRSSSTFEASSFGPKTGKWFCECFCAEITSKKIPESIGKSMRSLQSTWMKRIASPSQSTTIGWDQVKARCAVLTQCEFIHLIKSL